MKSPRPVKVLASFYGSNCPRCFDEPGKAIQVKLTAKAYNMSGVGPKDVSVLEIHDAASFRELQKTETLGFCKLGMLTAVKLYELGRLSSGRAAELAGMPRVEFLLTLGRYNVFPFAAELGELDLNHV